MRVLLTRPLPQSERLARKLAAEGVSCLISPVMRIEYPDLAGIDFASTGAILLTSANAAPALGKVPGLARSTPIFCVGDATAESVRALGFTAVTSARGTAADLARLVRRTLSPRDSAPLLYLHGERVRDGGLADLAGAGFEVRQHCVYRAEPCASLTPEAIAAIAAGAVDGVLLFSPHTAVLVAELLGRAGLGAAAEQMVAYCISAATKEAAARLPWHRIAVARHPDQESLLALMREC